MAFTSGNVATFDGATGLLTALLAYVCGTEVSAEVADSTPDGIIVSFSGTLAHNPVSPGQVVFRYTIGSQEYTAAIDGAGVITGTHITSGSITHSTAAWAIVFSTAPDDTTDILADYVYGAAGRDWSVKLNQTTRDTQGDEIWPGGDPKEVVLYNTGTSGDEAVYVGIREWEHVAEAAYGWNLNVYLLYSSGQAWNGNSAQHGRTSYSGNGWNTYVEHPTLPLHDDTIYYWLYSSKSRIIVVAQVASRYESIYMGQMRRFGSPSQYPYPLAAIGSLYGELIASSDNDIHRFMAGPWRLGATNFGAWIVSPGNAYKWPEELYFLPWHEYQTGDTPPVKSTNSKIPLFPVLVMDAGAGGDVYADLDGVFLAPTQNLQSEDVISISGQDYRVFQDIGRSTYWSFLAVKEL